MATAKNDITGDWIKSKPASDMFEQNFDRIFRKKKLEESIKDNEELYQQLAEFECNTACGHYECMEHQGQCKRLNKSVSRIEQIGQNGNDGIHYEYELDKSTGEVIKKED